MRKMFSVVMVFVLLMLWLVLFVDKTLHAENQEVRYTAHIKPIFEERCRMCHGTDAPEHREYEKDKARFKEIQIGPRMDSYTHLIYFTGWPDTGAIMRRLDDGKNTRDGKPGNMYHFLGDTEIERQKNLNLFKEWVGYWTLKRWAETGKEEIDKMKIKY